MTETSNINAVPIVEIEGVTIEPTSSKKITFDNNTKVYNDNFEDEEEEDEEEEDEEEEEDDEEEEDEEEDDEYKWEALNKLLDSHINITEAFLKLVIKECN
tara:strand:- start:458 stop:760 length:303 start_codon:yes stop_codon:yes gene_type:complete